MIKSAKNENFHDDIKSEYTGFRVCVDLNPKSKP